MKLLINLIAIIAWSTSVIAQEAFKAYNNYDFIPGETVLFEDDFRDSQDGEFPPRWNLLARQGVINMVGAEPAFVFVDASVGSMGRISPRIKNASYLDSNFTIEVDFLLPEDEMVAIYFKDKEGDEGRFISIEANGTVRTNYFTSDLSSQYPREEFLHGKWHHLAIAYKNRQMKIYINQYRVLVIPDCDFEPVSLIFGGSLNVKIKNVKVAEGGGMNMLDKILTDGKFISHAVKFDAGKSSLKGESMGFLNELVKWMKANQAIKLEIGGHTDSDGDESSNLKLSQARADAVKSFLVSQGIPADKITTKGFGETKPIDNNPTPEGKANNRRVEFVKLS